MLLSWVTSSSLFWSVPAGVLFGVYSIVYQLCWSSLRRFPGPKLWAISRIPSQLSVLRGHTHLDVTALHHRYGPVVRISPNELAFNTTQAFRDIYGARPGGCFAKDRSHYLPPANGVDHLVCAVDNAVHARQRRLLAHAFSERALRDQESLVVGYVDTLINKLRNEITKQDSPHLDIKNWMNYTTFDITGDLMFGESFDCLKDSQLHPWIKLIFSSIKALSINGVVHQFPLLSALLDALVPHEVKRKAQEHFNLAAQKVDWRLATNMARTDFMSAILQNGLSETNGQYRDGERIMSRAEIHSNAFMSVLFLSFPFLSFPFLSFPFLSFPFLSSSSGLLTYFTAISLIVAGSETAATLLTGCIYYLSANPAVMSRLVTEIRSAFAKDSDISFRTIASLPYLTAVIEESLRLYPPFVTSLARIVPAGGAMIDDHFVPEGVCTAPAVYKDLISNSFVSDSEL
ncbi:hypothetical protein N7510_002468 [Penicillium lagena]|uniref:uncharacterized protein n=1 Tax=Penicillium lagena TaxID=94218 RepID=UPI002540325B|nr:uncharacterized protein N7510_002468 [Penicillium lagena]KAJ5626159.1 hypothetical protein N7510_002468 [Penicillium lagena]